MKKLINSLFAVAFIVVLSTTVFAQGKPAHKHDKAMAENHECSEGCMDKSCGVKGEEATTKMEAGTSAVKHVCTEECKTKGCDYVKAKEARAALDKNHDGYIYECEMKCEASDKAGECSKCGMPLKKVSVTES